MSDRRYRADPQLVTAAVADAGATWESLLAGPAAVAMLTTAARDRAVPADLQTLALVERLREPQALPADADPRHAARLLCDGVLEVELDGGAFAGGFAARDAVLGTGGSEGRLDPLARTALLQVALRRPATDLAAARRLYLANAWPAGGVWKRRVDDAGGVRRLLGLASREAWARRLRDGYREADADAEAAPWLGWLRTGVTGAQALRHKVYVSPVPGQIRTAFAAVAEVCTAMDVSALKVAATADSLLRPDKIVLHLRSEAELRAVGEELERALEGVDAQGVPFTAPLDDRGLLSWAVDPPERTAPGRTAPSRSWRIWVAFLLARALVRARDAAPDDAIGFALDRVRLEGVDPAGWRWSAAG